MPDVAPTYSVDEAQSADAVECSMVDAVVTDGQLAVTIPPPGQFVVSESIGSDLTSSDVLAAAVRSDGELVVSGALTSGGGSGGSDSSGDGCGNDNYNLHNFYWNQTSKWYIRRASIPSGDIDPDNAVAALRRAIQNVTGGQSPCASQGVITATASYQGDTDAAPEVHGDGCETDTSGWDGKSVVAFGNDLNVAYFAMTCLKGHFQNPTSDLYRVIDEANIKINKDIYHWTATNSCSGGNQMDLENVATHEFGHWFGLDHVGADAAQNQTMYPVATFCETKKRTLGKGDLIGMNQYY